MKEISNSFKKKRSSKLNDRIERMKVLALSKYYMCNGELYKLLDSEYIIPLLEKLNDGKVQISSDIIYGRKVITKEEKFLDNLDKYISYVRNHYFIDHIELYFLLEMSLSNKYSKILFDLKDFHCEENYNMYFEEFRKMFNYNLYNNIYYYSKFVDKCSDINKFISEIKAYDYDNKEDSKQLEKIFIEMLSIRKNNIFNSATPYKKVKDRSYDFYITQVEWLISDYFKGRSLKSFKIENSDNYIEVGENTKLLFNICKKLSKLKDEDYVDIEFGIQNKNFSAKKSDCFFRKQELLDLLSVFKQKKKNPYDENIKFIDATLEFNFWGEDYDYLDIKFCYGNETDYYMLSLSNEDIINLYNLINKQL